MTLAIISLSFSHFLYSATVKAASTEVMLKKKGACAEYPCLSAQPFFSPRQNCEQEQSVCHMAFCPRRAGENLGPNLLASEITGSHFTDLNRYRTESLILVHQSERKFKQAGFLSWLMATTSCQLYKNLGTCSQTIFQYSMPCLILLVQTQN